MPEIKFKHFDEYRKDILKGVFLAGCVERGDNSSFRAKAHAHCDGDKKGWICIRSRKRLMTKTGKPGKTMLHELAHLISPASAWHNKTWRNNFKILKSKFWKEA